MSILEHVRGQLATVRRAMKQAESSIADIRTAIAALQSEREATRSAAVPPDEALAVLQEFTGLWARAGEAAGISLDHMIQAATTGRRPGIELYQTATVGSVLAVLAPLLRGPIAAGIEQALNEAYRDLTPGLPAADRQRRLAEIDGELLKLARLEEQAIEAAAEGGLAIDRRPDADPRAVLGVE